MGTTLTVCFNVGGTKHEVSRSLVEQYPDTLMAKMVSERWSDTDDALFIEGDAERFKYVLDFMRHGTISLPGIKESKDAFLKDLEYYGFCNVDSGVVQVYWDVDGAIQTLSAVDKLAREKEVDLLTEWRCTVYAFYCYQLYRAQNCSSGYQRMELVVPATLDKSGIRVSRSEVMGQPHFAKCLLSLFGLKVEKFEDTVLILSGV